MTFRKELCTTLISLGAFLAASQTYAVAVTDVSIFNPAGNFESSSATGQGKGNFKKVDINALFAGDPWTLLDTTNKHANALLDVSFLFTADTKKKSGAWELSWNDSTLPLNMDFVILLKGGKQWGAYLFEASSFSFDIGQAHGTFMMPAITKKGRQSKLLQASIFGRLATIPVGPASTPAVPAAIPVIQTDIPQVVTYVPVVVTPIPVAVTAIPAVSTSNSVPVPGSLALLVMGLGLGVRQLKPRNQAQRLMRQTQVGLQNTSRQ
jgi:hypothetical protein